MSPTSMQRPFSMKRAAINLLQVSAAYFAIGNTPVPGMGHHSTVPGRPSISTSRLAAGAWPMIALPIPAPRKPGPHHDQHAWQGQAANDEQA